MHSNSFNPVEERHDAGKAGNTEDMHNSLARLQYLVGFLMEKNEQLRQELRAKQSDGWN
jgi:hypothetical protein